MGSLLACAFGPEEPPPEEEILFGFAAPVDYVVQRGDTLNEIAEAHNVRVSDLRSWNNLEGDLIEVDQVLVVWASDERVAKAKLDKVGSGAASRKEAPAPKRSWNPLRRLVEAADLGPEPDPEPLVAMAEPVGAPTDWEPPSSVRGAGILDVDLGGSDADLEASARGMRNHDSALDSSGLSSRGEGLSSGGEADALQVERRALPENYGGVQIPSGPVVAPRMSRPSAKRCLAGPSERDLQGDSDMQTNKGLNTNQIKSGMSRVARSSARCFPKGTKGSYTVLAEVAVGCDGLVDRVNILSAGPVPGNVTACVQSTLGYASFSAHAVPQGVAFQYPLTYNF